MVSITIVPTTKDHIHELLETLRGDDRREIEALGMTAAKGLWQAYRQSLITKTALIDGKVGAVWGLGGNALGDVGRPWLMTSVEAVKISPISFARIYRAEARQMLSLFPNLVNYVWQEHKPAIRMLEICGFTIGKPLKLGNGMFLEFSMRAA